MPRRHAPPEAPARFFQAASLDDLKVDALADAEAVWDAVATEGVNTLTIVGGAVGRPLVDAWEAQARAERERVARDAQSAEEAKIRQAEGQDPLVAAGVALAAASSTGAGDPRRRGGHRAGRASRRDGPRSLHR